MDITKILKYFVYFFIIFCFSLLIIKTFNVKEGFDIVKYIEKNPEKRQYFYTEAEAGAVDFGITTGLAAINASVVALGVVLVVQLAIPIIGWIFAISTIAAIISAIAASFYLAAQWVKPNDPKTIEAANLEIDAIRAEINIYQNEINEMNLQFDTLKHEFIANQSLIRRKSKLLLKDIDNTIELIHDIYFPYLNDKKIPMINFYHECKNGRIYLHMLSDNHTLRKDLDIKSSDIDITLLDYDCFKYYAKNDKNNSSQNEYKDSPPPTKGNIKADITDYLIIVTYKVGDYIKHIQTFIDQQIKSKQINSTTPNKRKKHSISENKRTKLHNYFNKTKPISNLLTDHIEKMKTTILANAKLYKRRDELRSYIDADNKLIKEIEDYIPPHFHK